MVSENDESFVELGNKIIKHLYKTKPVTVGEGSSKVTEAIGELRARFEHGSKEHYLLRHLAAVLGEFLLGEEYKLDPFEFEQMKQERIERIEREMRKERAMMVGSKPSKVVEDERVEALKRLLKNSEFGKIDESSS